MIKVTTDKKINRIDRLSDYREIKLPIGINRNNGFYAEVSTKAFKKLEKLIEVPFNVCHDFDTGLFWLVVNGEGRKNRFDFTYLVQGKINTSVNGWDKNKYINVDFTHIDIATTWGLLEQVIDLLAEWLDKKYGEDVGFKRHFSHTKLGYAVNKIKEPSRSGKKTKESSNLDRRQGNVN